MLRVNYLCVSFLKYALIIVQVGLEANVVLINFARITCIIFSVRKSGNNKVSMVKSFYVKQSCRVLGQKSLSTAVLYF